jgi:hypothetical protein
MNDSMPAIHTDIRHCKGLRARVNAVHYVYGCYSCVYVYVYVYVRVRVRVRVRVPVVCVYHLSVAN